MAFWIAFSWILSIPLIISAQSIDYTPPPKSGNPKLESQLWEIAAHAGTAQKPIVLPKGLRATPDGKVIVFLMPEPGKDVSSIDLSVLERLDGRVLAQSKHLVRVALPPSSLEEATEIPGVKFIQRPIRPQWQRVTSEGASLINALANHSRNVKGQGVKVAIIDEGFKDANRLSQDMPERRKVLDFTQNTNEEIYTGDEVHGTACAEVVFDIAPEAELYLLKIEDLLDFENAKKLCVQEGVNIISYSGSWLGTGFGDGKGLACDIVNDAANNGILWVNSAGNFAQRQYTGLWADSNSNSWHDVHSDDELLLLKEVKIGDTVEIWLTWNDWPSSSEDYDLYLWRKDANGQLEQVVGSTNRQNGQTGGAPVEQIEYEVKVLGDYYGVSVKKTEEARTEVIKIWSKNHDFDKSASLVGNIGTPADARGALSVGAIYHGSWSSGLIEPYSSRGPTVDGRIKPDLVAPTRVSTVSYGANGFVGTSASAPHVAGAAALIKSANLSYTRDQLVDALLAAAVDLGDRGKDNTYGAGKIVLPLLQLPSGPNISSISPTSIRYGQTLTLRGQNFGNTQGSGKVVFNENVEPSASQYLSWTDTEIRVIVPTGARRGEVRVINNQGTSNSINIVITSPWVSSVSPSSVRTGQRITIRGENFGNSRGTSLVSIGATTIASTSSAYTSWSNTSITLDVPINTPPGNVVVQTSEGQSNPVHLGIISPYISNLAPTSARTGNQITITGGNFGTTRGTGFVSFGGVRAPSSDYVSWTSTQIVVKVPSAAQTGDVKVVTTNGESGTRRLEIITSPWISSISPSSVRTGQRITIRGENFGNSRGSSIVSIGSTTIASTSSAYVSWSNTSIVLEVPVNTSPGNVVVQTSQGRSNPVRLEITSPYISNLTPTSARPGDQITITGGNFGSTRGTGFVSFGNIRASSSDYVSWSATRIAVKVPSAAQTGDVKVVTTNGESGTRRLEVDVDRLERLPSVGVFGYSPPAVTSNPKKVSFEFQGIGRELVLSWDLKEASAAEVEVYVNGSNYGSPARDSNDWTGWVTNLNQSDLRTGQNIIEFRNSLNQNRSSGYDHWQLRSVKLWKPFDAKPLGGGPIPIASLSFVPFSLGLPFPSPFNSNITIPYSLSEDTQVNISIYNLAGQKVYTLYEGFQAAGTHTVLWNGKDVNGEDTSSGIYWIVLEAGEVREVAKVVLIR